MPEPETSRPLGRFWVDLHLHTVLSPCADLGMGAPEIAARCRDEGIDLIAVTDHNHIGNAAALRRASEEIGGPVVLSGMEAQGMEDIHAVAVFPCHERAEEFQEWLWRRMPKVENRDNAFGFQLFIDHENNIVGEEPILLIQGAQYTVDEIAARGMESGALVIPAHLDRPGFSYEAVLGRLPDDFPCSAIEVSPLTPPDGLRNWRERYPARALVRSSDAHKLSDISRGRCTPMLLAEPSFEEVRLALRGEGGRKVLLP
ncbi:MAG: PHP domain-containing protein [Synergistaceae bacterium]|jgi:PHP family Zn ribbon phosphoesterase|nr:PHP domain-containing protein [Synergistaceae bacterium]